MIRVLDVGANRFDRVSEMYPELEHELVRMDIDPEVKPDYVHDITQPLPDELHQAFDIVMASHVLEHLSWRNVIQAANNIAACVKPEGKLVILVPDVEWAAREILNKKGNIDLGVLGTVYGGQTGPWDFHVCGFSMEVMRQMIERIGFKIIDLHLTGVMIRVNDELYPGRQIVCEAVRKES